LHHCIQIFVYNSWGSPISHWTWLQSGAIIANIFLKPIRWLRSRTKSKAPQKGILLSFVQNDLYCHWGRGGRLNDQSGTTVHGRWHVTNNSEGNVIILKARLGYHATRFVQVLTHHPKGEREIFGKYPIPSHQTSEVLVVFSCFPPIGNAPKPIVSDVNFTDNFGNEHRVRSQVFSYVGSDKPV
jgi:hypothetical protein